MQLNSSSKAHVLLHFMDAVQFKAVECTPVALQRNNLSVDGVLFKPEDVERSNFRWDLPADQIGYYYTCARGLLAQAVTDT